MSAYDLSAFGTSFTNGLISANVRVIDPAASDTPTTGQLTRIDFYGRATSETLVNAESNAYIQVCHNSGTAHDSKMQLYVRGSGSTPDEILALTNTRIDAKKVTYVDSGLAATTTLNLQIGSSPATVMAISSGLASVTGVIEMSGTELRTTASSLTLKTGTTTSVATLSSTALRLKTGISLEGDAGWYLKKATTSKVNIDDDVTIVDTATAFNVRTNFAVIDSGPTTLLGVDVGTGRIQTNLLASAFVVTDSSSRLSASTTLPTLSSLTVSGTITLGGTIDTALGAGIVQSDASGIFSSSTNLPAFTAGGNIAAGSTYDIGSTGARFGGLFGTTLNVTGAITTGLTASSIIQTNGSSVLVASNTLPAFTVGGAVTAGSTYDLGSSGARFGGAFLTTLNVTGAITTGLTVSSIVQTNGSGVLTASTTLPAITAGGTISAASTSVDLGASGARFGGAFLTTLNVSSTITTGLTASSILQTNGSSVVTASNTLPSFTVGGNIIAGSTYDLGTAPARFGTAYLTNIDVSTAITTALTASAIVQTTAGSALTASTTLPSFTANGNILAASTSIDLATTGARFGTAYMTAVNVSDSGGSGNPTLRFNTAAVNGVYSSGQNEIGLTANSALFRCTTSSFSSNRNLIPNGATIDLGTTTTQWRNVYVSTSYKVGSTIPYDGEVTSLFVLATNFIVYGDQYTRNDIAPYSTNSWIGKFATLTGKSVLNTLTTDNGYSISFMSNLSVNTASINPMTTGFTGTGGIFLMYGSNDIRAPTSATMIDSPYHYTSHLMAMAVICSCSQASTVRLVPSSTSGSWTTSTNIVNNAMTSSGFAIANNLAASKTFNSITKQYLAVVILVTETAQATYTVTWRISFNGTDVHNVTFVPPAIGTDGGASNKYLHCIILDTTGMTSPCVVTHDAGNASDSSNQELVAVYNFNSSDSFRNVMFISPPTINFADSASPYTGASSSRWRYVRDCMQRVCKQATRSNMRVYFHDTSGLSPSTFSNNASTTNTTLTWGPGTHQNLASEITRFSLPAGT